MNKKRMATLAAAGITTVGLVGGTLAWFTSWDNVTNIFNTGKDTSKDDNSNGVEIYEKFTPPTALVPGTITDKLVQVKNTTDYDSFIRVSIDKFWTDLNGNKIDTLDPNKIELNFVEGNIIDLSEIEISETVVDGKREVTFVNPESVTGKWVKYDGYYYYLNKVDGGGFTNTLLESVKFAPAQLGPNQAVDDSDNAYMEKKFEVKVNAESIQADNEAYRDLDIFKDEDITDEDAKIMLLLKYYSNQNAAKVDGVDGVEATKEFRYEYKAPTTDETGTPETAVTQ